MATNFSTPSMPTIPTLALRAREAAKALSISERTLWSLTSPRGPIQAKRVGSAVIYPIENLKAWLGAAPAGTGERGGGNG
jgi:hypothetical protein